VGGSPKIAWCRFTDKHRSKSAQRGLYVVLLFSEGGETCFLSLNQGTDGIEGRVRNLLETRVSRAQQILGSSALAGLELEIDLNTSVQRGKNYEHGHVCGFKYLKDSLPTQEALIADINQLLQLLATLYDNEEKIMSTNEAQDDSGDNAETDGKMEQLAKKLNWPVQRTYEIVQSLKGAKKQIILGGPPGTGKTHSAEVLAEFFVKDSSHVKIVQFHPSYGYEDFMEGLRPVAIPAGGFEFRRVPGVIPTLASLIDGDNDGPGDGETRVLIIDEINRANISRVFGELMYLLEYRDKSIQLMLADEEFSLPENLIIIGTMNTADRSTRSLDLAMRRRFSFFELLPDVEILKKFYASGMNNELGDELFTGFENLNKKLLGDLDKHFTIGHSYFMTGTMNKAQMKNTWSQEIFPLIEEYFFDQEDRISEYSLNAFWPSV
jgi:DNA polymerase III delta prime subunit